MGDTRFVPFYERVRDASDRAGEIRRMDDEEVIAALAATAREEDPYLANVLATEAQNRARQKDTITRTLAEGVLAIDAEGLVTFMNPAAEEMLGWSLEELRGESMHDRVHLWSPEGERVPAEACGILQAVRRGETISVSDDLFTRRDGSRFPVAQTVAPILRDGEVAGAVTVFRDITSDKRAIDALRLRDRALAATTTGVTISDPALPDNPLVYANPAFLQMTGYRAEEVVGRNCRFLQGPGTDPEARQRIGEALREGRPVESVLLNYRKDGTPFWNRLSIAPVRDAAGRITHFVGIQEDVTAIKQAEEARREAEWRYEAILEAADHAGLGLFITTETEEGPRIRYASKGGAAMLGRAPEELVGIPALSLFAPEEQAGIAEVREGWRDVAAQARGPFHFQAVRPDGSRVMLEIGLSRARYKGAIATVVFFREASAGV